MLTTTANRKPLKISVIIRVTRRASTRGSKSCLSFMKRPKSPSWPVKRRRSWSKGALQLFFERWPSVLRAARRHRWKECLALLEACVARGREAGDGNQKMPNVFTWHYLSNVFSLIFSHQNVKETQCYVLNPKTRAVSCLPSPALCLCCQLQGSKSALRLQLSKQSMMQLLGKQMTRDQRESLTFGDSK